MARNEDTKTIWGPGGFSLEEFPMERCRSFASELSALIALHP